jgi:L-alanine-DL-glutamate epimerase-like enolase superfamily enzyme
MSRDIQGKFQAKMKRFSTVSSSFIQKSKRFSTLSGTSLFPLYYGPKITKITMYQAYLPLHEGSYKWSGGNSVEAFDSTIVKITTDTGIEGFGENTPLGPCYLPAYAEGTRAGIAKIAPSLLGADPTRLSEINIRMDKALKGHPYCKSALDMACWDILGKVAGLPVCELLGGRFNDQFRLYRAISQNTPELMASNVESYINQGYRIFQLKVGGNKPKTDIERIRCVREILDKKV